jgi:hypothetical protein
MSEKVYESAPRAVNTFVTALGNVRTVHVWKC